MKKIFYLFYLFGFCFLPLDAFKFSGNDAFINLNNDNSKLKITSIEDFQGWNQTAIIKALPVNKLFLRDDQEWFYSSENWLAPEESFDLINDFIIPGNQTIYITDSMIIDGRGNSLILGNNSQILVDAGVSVTFKNLKIKNIYNTASIPPIRCIDWYSQLCLDNVQFDLGSDFVFRNGQIFIHNDVKVTGTAKFSYRSARPSYIAENSNLIFAPQTTFEFYPSTTDNSLIKMYDESSKIFFDNSSLQTTHTGIRLTKGSVYFDNKVTLTSTTDDTYMDSLYYLSSTAGTEDTYSVDWSPDGKYLAVGNYAQVNRLYRLDGATLTLIDSTTETDNTRSVEWSPNGRYLIVGNYGQANRLYRLDGETLTLIDSTTQTDNTRSMVWCPNGRYLADGNYGQVNRLYRLDGESLTLVDSTTATYNTTAVAWSPDGRYLLSGNYNQTNILYRLDGDGLTSVTSVAVNDYTLSLRWHPSGKYLLVGNTNIDDSRLYRFTEESLSEVDSIANTDAAGSVIWSPSGKYLIIGNVGQANRLYALDGESLTLIDSTSATNNTRGVSLTPDGRYLFAGNFGQANRLYEPIYIFDITPQGYSNGIVLGDSLLGSNYDLNFYLNGGARAELYGKLWNDSILNGVNFENKNSFIALADANSKFKTTYLESLDGWRETSIIQSLPENNLFLINNQEWATSSNSQLSPEESFSLIGDLIIEDNQLIQIRDDIVIDGQGNELTLGRYSQILIDGGISVTFKNIKIRNTFNTVALPAIRCMDWYSHLCLDNVELAFVDDFAFRNGRIFIHNDVEFTGTSKFSYRSPIPSYITENSNLIFSPQTTFEFYPSTTDNSLIQMYDESSKIFFDNSSLLVTRTGIRLTKGSVYFDNKVTLSNGVDNTYTDSLYFLSATDEADSTYSVAWSPDGKYLAVGNRGSSGQANRLYKLVGDNLVSVDITDEADTTYSVAWSPDGRYLAVGNFSSEVNRLYRLDRDSLTLVDSTDEGDDTLLVAWSPNGRYLAVANYSGQVNRLYRLDGDSLTLIDSTPESETSLSVAWSPDGRYLAVGNASPGFNRLYRLDGESLILATSFTADSTSWSVAWNPDGKYLAIGRSTTNQLYRVDGESFSLVHTVSENDITRLVTWSPDGQYLAVGNYGNPNRLYKFEGESLALVASTLDADNTLEVSWSPDGRYLASGNYSAQVNRLYKPIYRFDITTQAYFNSIIFGDSSLGSDHDLNVHLNSGVRVELYGKLWEDSYSDGLTFVNKNSYISLADANSKFKITNPESFNGWRETAIIKSLQENTVFLTDNQEWVSSSNSQLAPQESFSLVDDLIIGDNEIVLLKDSVVIDGQGNELLLGRYSQLLIDGGVSVTFKNLKIRNTFNTIALPPIRCMDWYSQLCLDNVELDFVDDFLFRNGQLFIHDDVEFTGTSKFSYRSVRPSYITENSNLLFSPETTFEYYPSTTDSALIQMQDKTSKIFFDGSTLQTTHTGIMLTKGSVYFDNKVTLSSALTTSFSALLDLGVSSSIHHGVPSRSVSWSPDGRYLAVGTNARAGEDLHELLVYEFNGTSLFLVSGINLGVAVNSVSWSSNGGYLAVGTNDLSANVFNVYSFNDLDLTLVDSISFTTITINSLSWHPRDDYITVGAEVKGGNEVLIYEFNGLSLLSVGGAGLDADVNSVFWSPDGRYLAVGTNISIGNELLVYGFDGVSLSLVAGINLDTPVFSVSWSPDGKYLAIGYNGSTYDIRVYEWNGSSLSLKDTKFFGSGAYSVSWSPDGRYLAVGGDNSLSEITIYEFTGSNLIQRDTKDHGSIAYDVAWSPAGRYLAVVGDNVESDLVVYLAEYIFDTSSQIYSNGIIFGDSSLGSDYDLNVYLNSGARTELYGKLWQDSYSNGLTFVNKDSYISLADANSKFKITNPQSLIGWRENSIIKTLPDNYLFLTNNQEWVASSNSQLAPQESFELTSDFIIPDNEIVFVTTDIQIDGNNNNLIFGHNSNFLIDSGVTLTLKNMKLKNETYEKVSPYPFQVKGNNSKIAFDDVLLNLNGNITFSQGGFFVHDEVKISGSTEFVYSSSAHSFIEPNSCFYFSPGTSFFYNQDNVSTYTNLLIMEDETSTMYLDGATLRTTNTGLRLTTGKLFLDNNVTLSSHLTPVQAYSSGIIWGDSTLGESYDLQVYINSGARVDVYGQLWDNSLFDAITFANKNSFIILADQDARFKITRAESVADWKETGVLKPLPENKLFISSDQEWITSGDYIPQESFNLTGDLYVADNQTVYIINNMVIDGVGNSLILGHRSQLFIDSSVSVTLKNLQLKNTMNTISQPPVRCADWYSKLCLDNVVVSLNDDFVFRTGQLFIHNDVEFTGTSKFSYRSVRPSYIAKNSNLLFSPQTTFEFYPSTTDNSLIKMEDETSKIVFDSATLQTTHTGIRLSKGSIYFDNKVTLSSADNTYTDSLYLLNSVSESDVSYAVAWSPDGRYLAVGNYGANRLYRLDGESLTLVDTTATDSTNSVAWSPNGRYLSVGNDGANKLYRLDRESLTLADTTVTDSTNSVAWSPNGRYLAVGNHGANRLYRLDGETLTLVFSTAESDYTLSVVWSPNGKYLAVGNSPAQANRLYRLDGETLTLVFSTTSEISDYSYSLAWTPDGRYLAVGNSVFQADRLYRLDGEALTLVDTTASSDTTTSIVWSPDGRYLAVGNDSFQENRLYRLDGESLVLVAVTSESDDTYAVSWSPDGRYLVVGNSDRANRVYKPIYTFDTSSQAYSNSIVFGNSSLGAEYDLSVVVLAAARVEIFGKVFCDDI